MRRIVPIRITRTDRAEYARLARNSKAKIRRTKKKYGIDLTNVVDIPPIDTFKTRAEFNEWKQGQRSFTNRANTHFQFRKNSKGYVASVADIHKIERYTRIAQNHADKVINKIKKMPFYQGYEIRASQEQRMGLMSRPAPGGIYRPKDFDFDTIRSDKELKRKLNNMKAKASGDYYDKRAVQMQQNFAKLLSDSYNSDADELVKRILSMQPDDFFELYMIIGEMDFDNFYNDDDEAYGTPRQLEQLNTYMDRYDKGQLDMSLKKFG